MAKIFENFTSSSWLASKKRVYSNFIVIGAIWKFAFPYKCAFTKLNDVQGSIFWKYFWSFIGHKQQIPHYTFLESFNPGNGPTLTRASLVLKHLSYYLTSKFGLSVIMNWCQRWNHAVKYILFWLTISIFSFTGRWVAVRRREIFLILLISTIHYTTILFCMKYIPNLGWGVQKFFVKCPTFFFVSNLHY